MTQVEVEKSSRAIAEEAFHVKLGPRPAFPPSPAETGQVQPSDKVILFVAVTRGASDR
jgi:hypothetical protein